MHIHSPYVPIIRLHIYCSLIVIFWPGTCMAMFSEVNFVACVLAHIHVLYTIYHEHNVLYLQCGSHICSVIYASNMTFGGFCDNISTTISTTLHTQLWHAQNQPKHGPLHNLVLG